MGRYTFAKLNKLRHNGYIDNVVDIKKIIYSATSFEEIYHIVANAKIKHIGNLTIYDISLHIAYLLNPKALLPWFLPEVHNLMI